MESLSFFLLMCFLTQGYGLTHFHFLKEGEETTLSCETCKWEADVDSDNRVDCILSNNSNYSTKSECGAGKPDLCREIKRSRESSGCQISVKRGSFACVRDFKSDKCFIYQTNHSPPHVDTVVTPEEPDMSKDMESLVPVSAGGSINLPCLITTSGREPFVVYWIKTGAESSTCVYSFHSTSDYDAGFDAFCTIDEDLLLRRSKTSRPSLTGTNNHNLMISNATHSDRGQYVCALQVDIKDQQHWTIITNTTVTVDNPDSDKPGITQFSTSPTSKYGKADYQLRYYVIGILLALTFIIAVILILLREKVYQTVITQSFQNGNGEDLDDGCSPYAASQRETEPMYSLVQLPKQNADPVNSGASEPASEPPVIMKKNSIYDSAGP